MHASNLAVMESCVRAHAEQTASNDSSVQLEQLSRLYVSFVLC